MLVHGAGSGPWIFDGWEDSFPGMAVSAVDLQADVDVNCASMEDYADALLSSTTGLARPLGVVGWSLGGLVALMAAAREPPDFLVLIESSPPAEVQGFQPAIQLEKGGFDPTVEYGPFPPGVSARPESRLAQRERHRGISVPRLDCRALVVYGRDFPDERGRALAAFYAADELAFSELDHWGLVLTPRVRAAIADWILR